MKHCNDSNNDSTSIVRNETYSRLDEMNDEETNHFVEDPLHNSQSASHQPVYTSRRRSHPTSTTPTIQTMIVAATLLLSLSLSSTHHLFVSSFIITHPKTQKTQILVGRPISQLEMVSMAERVIQQESSSLPSSSTAATTNTATKRRRRRGSSNNTNVTVKRTTSKPKARSLSSSSSSSRDSTQKIHESNHDFARTAESIYNLPSYDEESKHWQEVVSILNSKIYDEDESISSISSSNTRSSSSSIIDNASTKKSKSSSPIKKQKRRTTTKLSASSSSRITTTKSTKTPKRKSRQHHRLTTMSKTIQTKKVNKNTTKKQISRSSTMPGFLHSDHTRSHTSFRDGIRIVQRANALNQSATMKLRNVERSERNNKKRKKANSEAMYASSASVPDSLIAFTNEIHLEERITPKEEVELGTRTQEAIRLQKIYDTLNQEYGREPSDDEWCAAAGKINMEALQDAIQDGIHAKNQLVTSNLRMVQGVVNLYIRNGLGSQYNAGDLMQEGTVALIRAAEKFEPERGFRFSTYAMYWIRAAVKRSQILQSRVINVPQRLHETHKKVIRVESQLKKELGRKPSDYELAMASGITETQLERCRSAISQQCFSLDAEIVNTLKPNSGDRSSETSYNMLTAKYDDVEYREMQSHFMKEDLVSTLRRYLSPHEVDLLLLRYGLMDEKTLQYGFSGPLTIAEVSRLVGLKPDKVRRMINKSLRQLRHLIAHEWEDFESVMQHY